MFTLFRLISSKKFKQLKQTQSRFDELVHVTAEATRLIGDISQGKWNTQVQADTANPLLQALLQLREQTQKVAHVEAQRRWINEGVAKFSDLLHQQNDKPEQLYDLFLSELVHYVGANQGGLFILNEEDHNEVFLELTACYAYERKKYHHKRIELGEGLVGQCFLEADTLLLTDIPKNYVNITSGLGKATPQCLVLVPLKVNDKMCGVVELASFHVFAEYQVSFIQKISENIASTIFNYRTTDMTRHLLEQAQQQAEELRATEEEMRQNLEELSSTQEELNRQFAQSEVIKREMQARELVLNYTTILSEADLYGTITYVNDKLCEVSKYSREELLGQPHNIFRHPDMPRELFKHMWSTIKQGKIFRGIVKNRAKDGTHYWVDANVSPVLDETGKPVKYISVRYVITDDRLAEMLYDECLQKLLALPAKR
jgi:PAS domain S-box-containing protein